MPDESPELDSTTQLAALERFVVENDDLLELEEHIGRFNIFDALKIVDREVKHSDYLAWLLDPGESHGQSGLFLRAVLMDLFKTSRENGFSCPVSPILLDGREARGVEVRREWQHIDILIKSEDPAFVVAIENKIRSGEHGDQLARYRQTVEAEFGRMPSMFVFLTVEGDEASEEDWVPYSYGSLHRVLTRVRTANGNSIGEDLLMVLDHYLRLIRGRLMDDPTIAALCQRIYKNHRQALQLIYEHAGSPVAGLMGDIEGAISAHAGGWHLINKTSRQVTFIPRTWLGLLPPIGARATFDPRSWVVLQFEVYKQKAFLGATVWPTNDVEVRRRVVERLTRDRKEFGFRLFQKTSTNRWTQLCREQIGAWTEDEGPDESVVVEAARRKLDELVSRLRGVPEALRPILT